jgi:MFS family permease
LILAHLQPLPLLVFYLMTVFTLSWATSDFIPKGFSINAVVFGIVFRVFIPVSALIADRIGRRKMLIYATTAIAFFWFCLFFFLEFRQSSSGDFVLMYRNGFDGVYLRSFGNFLVGIVSYEHSLFGNFFGI